MATSVGDGLSTGPITQDLGTLKRDAAQRLRTALGLFASEPLQYALRPSVASVLQEMTQTVESDSPEAQLQAYNDSVAYREGEAEFVLAMQHYHCLRVLEATTFRISAHAQQLAQQQQVQAHDVPEPSAPPVAPAAMTADASSGRERRSSSRKAGPKTPPPATRHDEAAHEAPAADTAAAGPSSAAAGAFRGTYVKDTLAAVAAALQAVRAYGAWRNAALAAGGLLPSRFDRLVVRLALSSKEARLLSYCLYHQTSQEESTASVSAEGRLSKWSAPVPQAFVGMTTQELLVFLDAERRHIKEGLIPDCSKMLLQGGEASSPWSNIGRHLGSLTLGYEVVKALMGHALSQEEMLKVDKTALMEVLAEEPGFSRHSHHMMLASQHSAGAGGEGGAAGRDPLALAGAALGAKGGAGGGLDLYELIKAEVARDSGAAPGGKRVALGALLDEVAGRTPGGPGPGRGAKRPRTGDDGAGATPPEAGADAAAGGAGGDDEMEGVQVEAQAEGEAEGEADEAAAAGSAAAAAAGGSAAAPGKKGELRPYASDLEYLEDCFKLLMTSLMCGKHRRVLAHSEEGGEGAAMQDFDDDYYMERTRGGAKTRASQQVRELEGRERLERSRIETRLKLTSSKRAADGQPPWRPRLERLAEARSLAPFEKQVLLLLVGCRVSPSVMRTLVTCISAGFMSGSAAGGIITVGNLLLAFYPSSLADQISARRYFYKSGQLVKDGIVTLHGTDFSKDIMDQGVDIDRRMLDFLVGLDTEFSDMVDGSHLYYPSYVGLEDVVLPQEQKQVIVETVENFSRFKKARAALGMDVSGPGNGLVLLFHGASGVGKTMMANAVAHHVNKKVLLINFPSLGSNQAGEVVRFIFREAKIHDALLFFDECESIFEERDVRGNHSVNMLLTEVERYDGIVIMATNRPHDIDEAMHRRITMAFEFRRPDHVQRLQIWRKQLPSAASLAPDVDLQALALKYELSGGYIRNAVQAALSKATARTRSGDEPVVLCHADLLHGAALQLRGALRLKDHDRQRVPRRGLDEVLLPPDLKDNLSKVVQHEKARAVLVGQWGFGSGGELSGTVCLFHGPPGTGKTLAAEAVGFETGRPLKVVNCAGLVSKWVGDTPKNIDALFRDARAMDAVLVFDEAEGLFGTRPSDMGSSTDRYAAMDVGVLLHHLETHPGIVVLITNQPSAIDKAFHRRIRFMLGFKMPDAGLRAKLWRAALPQQAPLEDDIDWRVLGDRFELAGGAIHNAVIRAATRAALRLSAEGSAPAAANKITMADLLAEAQEEVSRTDGATAAQVRAMYM